MSIKRSSYTTAKLQLLLCDTVTDRKQTFIQPEAVYQHKPIKPATSFYSELIFIHLRI